MKVTTLSAIAALTAAASAKTLSFEIQRRGDAYSNPAEEHRRVMRRRGLISRDTATEGLTWGNLLYFINFTLGTPPQNNAAWLDTGSSDLWVPDAGSSICEDSENGCFDFGSYDPRQSSTYNVLESNSFQIAYASGDKISGDYLTDKLSVAGQTIDKMVFGLASQGQTQTKLGGIMGIGYPAGESIVGNQGEQPYPNLIAKLVEQGSISSPVYSLYLNDIENGKGEILFGGIDEDKYEGELGIIPTQLNSQTDAYDTFTVVLSSLSFKAGSSKSNIDLNGGLAVILDSGTTFTYFPDDIAQAIYDGLGVSIDQEFGGPLVPCNIDPSNMGFTFTFGGSDGVSIDIGLDQFIVPLPAEVAQETSDGVPLCNFGIYPAGSVAQGQGDILFGDTFLRSVYVMYDLGNNQIGMAHTKFDQKSSNVKDVGDGSAVSGYAIPDATTVADPASIAQTATGGIFQTGIGFEPTSVAATGDGNVGSPTFKGLGTGLPTGTHTVGAKNDAPRAAGGVGLGAVLVAVGASLAGMLAGGSLFAWL